MEKIFLLWLKNLKKRKGSSLKSIQFYSFKKLILGYLDVSNVIIYYKYSYNE